MPRGVLFRTTIIFIKVVNLFLLWFSTKKLELFEFFCTLWYSGIMKVIRIDSFFFQLSILLSVIFVVGHLSATMFDWYYIFPWLDIPVHITGGAFITSIFYMLTPGMSVRKKFFITLIMLGIVSVGVEFIEWFIDTFVRMRSYGLLQENNWDTFTDIIHNYIGGLLLFIFAKATQKL